MIIPNEFLLNPIDFDTYHQIHRDFVEKYSQDTSQVKHYHYIQDNLERTAWVLNNMHLEKKLYNILDQLPPIKMLAITMDSCGDASEIIPLIHSMTEASEHIDLEIYERDSHHALMDLFLTNGARAIPIIIITDMENRVLAKWGPRPAEAQALVQAMKESDLSPKEKTQKLHDWYRADQTKSTQFELYDLLKQIQEQYESIRN